MSDTDYRIVDIKFKITVFILLLAATGWIMLGLYGLFKLTGVL